MRQTSQWTVRGIMTNERLRAELHSAGITVERLSDAVEVDPKTVERWISTDRVPHRAHR